MTYERFEDLPVWNAAVDLAAEIFAFTASGILRGKGDAANQLERAALSVSNNIAEGFERGTTTELIHFLYIARGSAGEVRSILHVIERLLRGTDTRALRDRAESVSRQLRAWAESLQNSDIRGQKHLTQASKASYPKKKKADPLRKQLQDQHEALLARLSEERARREGPPPESPA